MRRVQLLLATGSLVTGAAFVADLRGYFKPDPRPVAFLRSSDGTVRRLAKGHLAWDRMGPGAVFGLGDTVSTVGFSTARLMFYAGGELQLGPDSMVTLAQETENVRVDLMMGAGRIQVADRAIERLVVGQDHPAQVTLGRKFNVPRQAEARVGADSTSGFPVFQLTSIPESSLRRHPADAGRSDSATMISSGLLPPVPKIVFPLDHSVIEADPRQGLTLDWGAPGEPKPITRLGATYEVRIKRLESSEPLRTYRTRATRLTLERLPPGSYRWSAFRAIGRRRPAQLLLSGALARDPRTLPPPDPQAGKPPSDPGAGKLRRNENTETSNAADLPDPARSPPDAPGACRRGRAFGPAFLGRAPPGPTV